MAASPRPSISSGAADVRGQFAHRADRRDHPVAAEDEGVLDDAHVPERRPSQRARVAARRRSLGQIADQQVGHDADDCCAADAPATLGRSSPPSRAASSASG